MKEFNGVFGSPSPLYFIEDLEYSPGEPSKGGETVTEAALVSLYQIEEISHPSPTLAGRVVHQKSYPLPKNKIELQSLYNSLSIEEKKLFTNTLNYLFQNYEKWLEERNSKSYLLNSIGTHGGNLAFSLHSPFIEDLLEPLAQSYKEKDHPLIDSVYYFFLRHVLRISNNPSFVLHSCRDQNLDLLKNISPFFMEMVEKISRENEWLNGWTYTYFHDEHAIATHLLLKKNLVFFKNNLHALLEPRVEGQAKLLKNKVVRACPLKKCASQKSQYHKTTIAKNTVDIYSDNFFVEYDENGFLSSVKSFSDKRFFFKKPPFNQSRLGIEGFFPKRYKTILSDETRKEIAECLRDPQKAPSCEILFLFHKIEEPYHTPFPRASYHYEELALNTGINTNEVYHFLTNPISPIWKNESSNIPFCNPINPNSPLVSDYLKLQKLYRALPINEKKELRETLSFLFDAFKSWLYKFYRSRYLSECLNACNGGLSFPLLSNHLMPLFVTLARHFEDHKNDRVEAAHFFFLKNILNLKSEQPNVEESLFKEIIGKVSLKYVDMLFQASEINRNKAKPIERTAKIKPIQALGFILLLLKSLHIFKNNPLALLEPKKIFGNDKFLRHQEVSVYLIRKPTIESKPPYINPSTIYVNEIGLPASIVSRRSGTKITKVLSVEESQKWIGLIENSPKGSEPVPFFLFYKVKDSFLGSASLTQKTYYEDFAFNLGLSTAEVLFFLKNPKSDFWYSESVQALKDFHYSKDFYELIKAGQNENEPQKRKEPPPFKKTQEPAEKKIKLPEPNVPDYNDILTPVSNSFDHPSLKSYFNHKHFFDNVVLSLESFKEERSPGSLQEMPPFLVQQRLASVQTVTPPTQNQTKAIHSFQIKKTGETPFLQKFSLETATTFQIRGLPNIGNSCYINAALQILNHIPFYRNFIGRQKYLDLASILASDVQAALRKPGVTLNLSNLNTYINNTQKLDKDRVPVDRSEFSKPENLIVLKYLIKKALIEKSFLESLQATLNIYSSKTFLPSIMAQCISRLRSYLFQTVFYGEADLKSMQDPVQVLEKTFYSLNMHITLVKEKFALGGTIPIGQKEKQPSTILQLSLPTVSENLTLQELIDLNFSRTVLHDKDPLRIISETGQVYESKDWEEEYSLENPNTKYLVFQLKRYYQTNDGEFQKNSNPFPLSKVLDLAKAFKSNDPKFYRIKAAILHDDYGSNKTNSGHYTSLVEVNGKWHHINDWKVTTLPFPEKMLSESYIFFLEAVE